MFAPETDELENWYYVNRHNAHEKGLQDYKYLAFNWPEELFEAVSKLGNTHDNSEAFFLSQSGGYDKVHTAYMVECGWVRKNFEDLWKLSSEQGVISQNKSSGILTYRLVGKSPYIEKHRPDRVFYELQTWGYS